MKNFCCKFLIGITILLAALNSLTVLYYENRDKKIEEYLNIDYVDVSIAFCSLAQNINVGGKFRVQEMLSQCYANADQSNDQSYESVKMCIFRDVLFAEINSSADKILNLEVDISDYASEENMMKRVSSRLLLAGFEDDDVLYEVNKIKKMGLKSIDKSFEYCFIEFDKTDGAIVDGGKRED